jgi:glycerophosphoryl diester phosphodiesterase
VKSFILVSLFLFAPLSYAQSIFERLQPPLVAAHMGGYLWAGGSNTLPQFEEAIKDGADIIETDLHVTKDNVVIVYHDENIKSMTCYGEVINYTYAEIKNCGKNPPKFEDMLLQVNGRAIINAEFKTQDVVIPAIQLIQKLNAYDWVYFQTKASQTRYELARSTDSKVALLFKAKDNQELNWALSRNDPYLVVIEMEKEMANPENIQKTHAAKKLVSVNSWRYGSLGELMSAACDKVFPLGIDIAVANNTRSCVKQKP